MTKAIAKGRQVYVICPTVEYSEAVEGENVIEYAEKLKRIMPVSVNIEFLHGRMKPGQKKMRLWIDLPITRSNTCFYNGS